MESKKRKQYGPATRVGIEKRALRVTYKKRKECIMRKTMELATLCDIKACTVCLGPEGELDTWPENPTDVKAVINIYNDYEKEKQNFNKDLPNWLNGLSTESLGDFLRGVESKIEAVTNRAEFLKVFNEGFHGKTEETIQTRPYYWSDMMSDESNFNFYPTPQPLQAIMPPNYQTEYFLEPPPLPFYGNLLVSRSPILPTDCFQSYAASSSSNSSGGGGDMGGGLLWSGSILEETKFNVNGMDENSNRQFFPLSGEMYPQPSPLREVINVGEGPYGMF